MQRLYTNILCTQWLIYTNKKGHISHVVVLGQDTVVPPALAFAACFQIQHWGSGGLAAWGRPLVQTRHGRLEVPAKMANPKKNGWDMVRCKTVHPFLHASSNKVFSPNSSNMSIIEKNMGHFHRREPSKCRCSLHLPHNLNRCIRDSIYSTAVSKVVARPPLRVHAQEFIDLSLQTRLLLRIHGEILTRFAHTSCMVGWMRMDTQWMQQSCM